MWKLSQQNFKPAPFHRGGAPQTAAYPNRAAFPVGSFEGIVILLPSDAFGIARFTLDYHFHVMYLNRIARLASGPLGPGSLWYQRCSRPLFLVLTLDPTRDNGCGIDAF